MTGRAQKILSRFPVHLEAGRPGKLLGDVVENTARDLDAQAASMAGIRRAHRLGDADELRDLLLIAGLHGIDETDLSIVFVRFHRAAELLNALANAAAGDPQSAAVERLVSLWGIADKPPLLPLYAPPSGGAPPDLAAAAARLRRYAGAASGYSSLLVALRSRIAGIAAIHSRGNGTVRALLEGASNALDLDIGQIANSEDRYWHAAPVRDRIGLSYPVQQGTNTLDKEFAPADEVIGIEENPLWRDQTDPAGRANGELFTVLRRGFERALLQVRITGQGKATVGPMLVNRDEGHGVGFALSVPDGKMLTFTEQGRALLDGSDVTSFACAWKGACFAGDDAKPERDFVFDGPGVDPARKRATFAQSFPDGALESGFVFPHAGESLPMPGIGVGETRLAFFVQVAHFSSDKALVAPRTAVGFFDGSVFSAAKGEKSPVAAKVSLSWLEHRAFSVRLLIPPRFRVLTDDPDGAETRQRLVRAVKRFRPAGIEVTVDFVDERWTLGEGTLTTVAAADPLARIRGGTVLWPAPK